MRCNKARQEIIWERHHGAGSVVPFSLQAGNDIFFRFYLTKAELLGLTWENVDLKYENLVLVLAPVHELIHAVGEDTISSYLSALKLDASQLAKLNKLRILANRKPINLENLHLTNNSHNGMTKETKKTV